VDLPAVVGADVAAVLARLGSEVVGAASVTALPSRATRRAAFRIDLADGRAVKVRRLARVARARRFARMVRGLAEAPLAALLVLEGRIAVEEWIDGTPLSALPPVPTRLRRAGEVLGRLHATGRMGRRRLPAQASTGPLLDVTERRLARLCARGAVARAEVRALRGVLARFAPDVALFGVTHNDFCAENVVETRASGIVAIDNEGMRLGFLDYDLARTRYRWPMSATAWMAFLDGYTGWRDPGDWVRHAPFWWVAALVKSAHVRFDRTDAADVPLGRLHDVVATRGASAEAPSPRGGRRSASRTSRKGSARCR
jgi:Ser/Thr protein kinase RdoA (MazF antagonist)